mmetsp:Transcript_3060/g.7023  ORF Transcript_3060/g.7023 Transcript_3060/m.7023 type:complete len:202 (-) Transcript_3060:383-988(-)
MSCTDSLPGFLATTFFSRPSTGSGSCTPEVSRLGLRTRMVGALGSPFSALSLWRRFASFASLVLRRRNTMMDEMNLSTSSRPSWLTEDVGIMDGSRCHFSISCRSSSCWFSFTDGMPGLKRSVLVKMMVKGTSCSMSQSAYSLSLGMGGMEASTRSNTPARLERVVKYPLVNVSHLVVSSSVALANPYPGRSTIHHFWSTR